MRRRVPRRQHQKVVTLVWIYVQLWRSRFADIRCWWNDPKGVLSVARGPFHITYLPSAFLQMLAEDADAREYVFSQLDEQRREEHPAAQ